MQQEDESECPGGRQLLAICWAGRVSLGIGYALIAAMGYGMATGTTVVSRCVLLGFGHIFVTLSWIMDRRLANTEGE